MNPPHHHTKFTAGCPVCQKRDRENARARRRALAYGDWPNQLVDAAPVLAHINRLSPPMSRLRISKLAGVSEGVLSRICGGHSRKLQRWTADAILGVRLQPPLLLPAVPSMRKLRALACDGWPLPVLAARGGMERSTLFVIRLPKVHRVTPVTHARIDRIYQDHWHTPGPSQWLREYAADRWGYLPHEAWPGDSIDDPDAQPFDAAPLVDEVMLERVRRDPSLFGDLRLAEQVLLYQQVLADGETDYRFRKTYRPMRGVMPQIYLAVGLGGLIAPSQLLCPTGT